jgi:hypothetical protein
MRALLLLLLPTASCLADTVATKDGTFLKGRIERIASGVLEMRVPVLGEANVQRLQLAQVESFVTDDAVMVSSGGVVSRGAASAAGGRVASQGGAETSPLDASLELWRDPSLRPAETAGKRQWTTQADVDVSGRNGVVMGSGFSAGFSAKGVTKANTVTAGVRLVRADAGNQTSADDLHLTASYETNPTDVVFWYVRSDSGYDNARLIDFFSVNAGGWGFRLRTDAKGKLDARLGLAHRYEVYASPGQASLSAPSADIGLIFTRELGWAAWDTSLNFVPSFQAAEDFYIRHETSLNVLRSAGPLSLRVGVSNDYRSKPLPTQVKTDTSYFLRTTYVWK